MTLSSKLQSLLPKKRWQRPLLEAVLILADILRAQYGQTRGLPNGAVPQLVGVFSDGSVARVGAGDTATLAVSLSARGRNIRFWWAEAFPA